MSEMNDRHPEKPLSELKRDIWAAAIMIGVATLGRRPSSLVGL